MAHMRRCRFSTSSKHHSSAAEACAEILSRFSGRIVSTRVQRLDANQLHLLHVTLNRSPTSFNYPPQGTPVPPGHHLVYFTPSIVESELGFDGTDRTVNPLGPYTRRMWAGGELKWNTDPKSFLRTGQEVQEITKLVSAEPRQLKNGNEMLLIGVEKTFSNEQGIALTDGRSWVFQREIRPDHPIKPPPAPHKHDFPVGKHQREFCQSAVTLFRFSALTFNGHKIHYQPAWCREVEGHRAPVVHGPLNLIHILDFWRDTARDGDAEALPKSIAYRAVSPLYVEEPYRILLDQARVHHGVAKNAWDVQVWDNFGRQSMKGTITE